MNSDEITSYIISLYEKHNMQPRTGTFIVSENKCCPMSILEIETKCSLDLIYEELKGIGALWKAFDNAMCPARWFEGIEEEQKWGEVGIKLRKHFYGEEKKNI